ncbi:MAG: hypothetical protein ABL962_10960 [Fimbriimonadaceae bacterium]
MKRLAVVIWISLAAVASASVGSIDLAELAKQTAMVVIADVRKVETIGGIKIATADVVSKVKGQPDSRVYFVAQPTWKCDISSAAPGERVLLFLNAIKDSKAKGSPDLRAANQEIARRGASLYLIAHSGRGQIVLRKAQGWSASVEHQFDKRWELQVNLVLPKGSQVKKENAKTGRVELSTMLAIVARAAEPSPKSTSNAAKRKR